ncbi:hypothetical protein EV421DRAFT_1739473 [Armillaria borealis]|uniref:Uncharacterized protein n=1 Tax=Armillaria borealis TaxID=47425 RepID=A0AA39J956_9AGAR|nr:hypothetical protein EV421DRAFT_1739473 [Armillaria borealis]
MIGGSAWCSPVPGANAGRIRDLTLIVSTSSCAYWDQLPGKINHFHVAVGVGRLGNAISKLGTSFWISREVWRRVRGWEHIPTVLAGCVIRDVVWGINASPLDAGEVQYTPQHAILATLAAESCGLGGHRTMLPRSFVEDIESIQLSRILNGDCLTYFWRGDPNFTGICRVHCIVKSGVTCESRALLSALRRRKREIRARLKGRWVHWVVQWREHSHTFHTSTHKMAKAFNACTGEQALCLHYDAFSVLDELFDNQRDMGRVNDGIDDRVFFRAQNHVQCGNISWGTQERTQPYKAAYIHTSLVGNGRIAKAALKQLSSANIDASGPRRRDTISPQFSMERNRMLSPRVSWTLRTSKDQMSVLLCESSYPPGERSMYGKKVAACITQTYSCVLTNATHINYASKTSGLVPIPSAVSWRSMAHTATKAFYLSDSSFPGSTSAGQEVLESCLVSQWSVLYSSKQPGLEDTYLLQQANALFVASLRSKTSTEHHAGIFFGVDFYELLPPRLGTTIMYCIEISQTVSLEQLLFGKVKKYRKSEKWFTPNRRQRVVRRCILPGMQAFIYAISMGIFSTGMAGESEVTAVDNENVFYNEQVVHNSQSLLCHNPHLNTVGESARIDAPKCARKANATMKAAYDARAVQDPVPQCSLSPSGCSSKEPAVMNVKRITRVGKTNALEIQTRRKYLTRQTKALPLSNNAPLVPPIPPTDIFPKLSAEAKALQDKFNSFIQGTSIGEYAESLLRAYFKSNSKRQGQISVFVDPLQDLYELRDAYTKIQDQSLAAEGLSYKQVVLSPRSSSGWKIFGVA